MSETQCPKCGSPFKTRGLGQRVFHCGSLESETTGVVVQQPNCLRNQLAAAERRARIAERALRLACIDIHNACVDGTGDAEPTQSLYEDYVGRAEAELYPDS